MKNVKVLVASKNPVKVKATTDAFQLFFEAPIIDSQEIVVPTANASQPIGEEQTSEHSKLRVVQACESYPGYDYYVGIEGGIVKMNSNKARIIVYSSVGHNLAIETIRGCGIPLPLEWYNALINLEFHELGDLAEQKHHILIAISVSLMGLVPYLNPSLFLVNE